MIFGTDDTERDKPWEPVLQTASVEPFAIEQTEVTNELYRLCVDAGTCDKPKNTSVYDDAERAQYPVAYVTALQAAAYCAWIDRRLPTEFEWERAARGLNGQLWPWGADPPTPDRAVLSFGDTVLQEAQPIKSREAGKSADKVYDLIGNVSEWTGTQLKCDFEKGSCTREPWDGKDAAAFLAIRGGGFNSRDFVRSTQAIGPTADNYDGSLGFRCAQ